MEIKKIFWEDFVKKKYFGKKLDRIYLAYLVYYFMLFYKF